MYRASAKFEFRFAEIAPITVQSDAQFRTAPCLGELDMHIVAVYCFLEPLDSPLGAQSGFPPLLTITESVDEARLTRPIRIRGRGRGRRILGHLFHLLPQAERPHICPNLF